MNSSLLDIHHFVISSDGNFPDFLNVKQDRWLFFLVTKGDSVLSNAGRISGCGPGMLVCPPGLASKLGIGLPQSPAVKQRMGKGVEVGNGEAVPEAENGVEAENGSEAGAGAGEGASVNEGMLAEGTLEEENLEEVNIPEGSLEVYTLEVPSSFILEFANTREMMLYLTARECRFFKMEDSTLVTSEKYFKTMLDTMAMQKNLFVEDAVKNLALAFLCNCYRYYYQAEEPHQPSRMEALTNSFIQMVIQNCRKERMMSFYADGLGVSAKYLSDVVSSVTGKKSSKWIEEFTIACAQNLMKDTSLTVNQISDRMYFKSTSDFCKYFRRGTGMSPNEYRSRI